jgi:hypothetical protein
MEFSPYTNPCTLPAAPDSTTYDDHYVTRVEALSPGAYDFTVLLVSSPYASGYSGFTFPRAECESGFTGMDTQELVSGEVFPIPYPMSFEILDVAMALQIHFWGYGRNQTVQTNTYGEEVEVTGCSASRCPEITIEFFPDVETNAPTLAPAVVCTDG